MTRISEHTAVARIVTPDGDVTDLGEVAVSLNFDEAQSPFGEASVTASLPEDETVVALIDPLTHRGLRLNLEMRESIGDPVRVSEITADHGGSIAALTAAYGPAITPQKLTDDYFTAWNVTDVRPGSTIRGSFVVTEREIDHDAQQVRFAARTDEALLWAYKLMSNSAESSGASTVRDLVNYALGKIGAALQPGPADATITETDASLWEPGVSGWEFVRGAAEAYGLVVRCDERRRWTLTDRAATRPEVVAFDAFTQVRERVTLDDDTWADAVVMKYEWIDAATGAKRTRGAVASDTSDPFKIVTIPRNTPYPGGNPARYWLNRLRARGRTFTLEQVSDYTLRPGMGFTASIPGTTAQVGYIESVSWSVPDDRCQITTRGSADAVGNAIDLFPVGLKINDLVGKINDLTVGG